MQGLRSSTTHAGVGAPTRTAARASAVDFVLEGLYAQKKITRSDEFQYQAAEQRGAPRDRRREPLIERDSDAGERRSITTEPRCADTGAGFGREFMKYRYSKFTGDDLDEIDLEELLSRLSDLLLSSGFDDGYAMPGEDRPSMQSLHDAIMEALLNGGLLSEETLERLLGEDWQTATMRKRSSTS